MITYIIGKGGNLSRHLEKALPDARLISARELAGQGAPTIAEGTEPYNIILNSFWPAHRLGDVSDPAAFIEAAIGVTAKVLGAVGDEAHRVRRLFYTSSASVYGNAEHCAADNLLQASSLYAALKIANEKLVEKYCGERGIDYTIARVFNMFGGDDHFSIISKMIRAVEDDEVLNLINDGAGIRDFIHVDDVAAVYARLVESDSRFPVVNIGTGVGLSVRSILDALGKAGTEVRTSSVQRAEIPRSIADTAELTRVIGDGYAFVHPVDFLLDRFGR